jgi:hypothetical protein
MSVVAYRKGMLCRLTSVRLLASGCGDLDETVESRLVVVVVIIASCWRRRLVDCYLGLVRASKHPL